MQTFLVLCLTFISLNSFATLEGESKYPNFYAFLKSIDIKAGIRKVDPRNRHLTEAEYAYYAPQSVWDNLFKAAIKDNLTVLRAFGLLATNLKDNNITIMGPGDTFLNAVNDGKIDLGLALPATNIAFAVWSPINDPKSPELKVRLKVFYNEPFTHKFPDDILPANLKIGYGKAENYWWDNKEYKLQTVTSDLFYGDGKTGFTKVTGIGGQQRGFMGVMQTILFFLPDAVHAMYIDEKKDQLITEALINTTVDKFETTPKYGIHYK
ncbi:MAG: hypothetical protein U0T83_03725 [Bacteriovoracaceae bacterium]